MCGIAGSFLNTPSEESIRKALNYLKERGPDNSGVYQDSLISLIHTRLTVIDPTDEGKQPIIDTNTGVTIIFNGAIYNYRELQKKYNLDPRINSDTRILLLMYLKFGLSFVDKVNGMFAIAIWDPRSHSLHLIRDRFGIKPLYIHSNNNKILFASEVNALFALGVEREIDLNSVKNYISEGILENNKITFFKKIKPVPPASIVTINKSQTTINKYWDLNNKSQENKKNQYSDKDISEMINEKLTKAINSNLVSDVPVGLTLSSGIDSSIILKNLLENKKLSKLSTYTYGYDDLKYDETRLIKKNNTDSRIDHNFDKMNSNSLIPDLTKAIDYFQSPLGGLGTLSMFNLMKIVQRDKIKVILSGEGADEVFAGYKYYNYANLMDLKCSNRHDELSSELKYWHKLTGEDLSGDIKNNKIFNDKIFGLKAPDGTKLKSFNLEGPAIRELPTNTGLIDKLDSNKNLFNLRYEDIFTKKLPKLLMFQDRCSMHSGVESRVPFLDHDLVETVFSLDSTKLIKNGVLKYLLRNNSKVNNDSNINFSQKKYVATPQREWIKQDNYSEIVDIISSSKLGEMGIINLENFKKQYMDYKKSNEIGNSFFVWKVLNLSMLYK